MCVPHFLDAFYVPAMDYMSSTCRRALFHTPFYFYREWAESGQLWIQQVSSTPATRLDVVNLQVDKSHYKGAFCNA